MHLLCLRMSLSRLDLLFSHYGKTFVLQIQPNEEECIAHFESPTKVMCGDFKMAENFYGDCLNFMNKTRDVPQGIGTKYLIVYRSE